MSKTRWIHASRKDRLLTCGVRFFMAAALTGNQTAGGYAPFALGCVAAAGPGPEGISALLGALAGAVVFLDFANALPFLASAVLILAAATAFRGSAALSRPRAVGLTAAGMSLAVSLICVAESLDPAGGLAPCLAASALTGASAWYFYPLLRPRRDQDAWAGALFLSAALLLAVQEVTVWGVSLGRLLLCTLLAWTAWGRGAAAGAAAGLGAGLTADLCAGGGSGLLTAAMGLGGLLCGRCRGGKRWQAAGLFLLGTAAAVLAAGGGVLLASPVDGGVSGGAGGLLGSTGDVLGETDGVFSGAGSVLGGADTVGSEGGFVLGPGAALLAECALGMVLFLTLPRRLFDPAPEPDSPPVPDGAVFTERLDRAAAALRELYDACEPTGAEVPEEGPSEVFDRAAERVCRDCPLCSLCWEDTYAATYQALNGAAPRLADRGRLFSGDLPARFTDRCVRLGEFLSAVNAEQTAYLLRRQYRRRLEEARTGARRQYAQMSELLSATAASLREQGVPALGQDRCRVGTELRPRRGESVCGDTAEAFQRTDGVWCLLLADGMGSGERARRESALTCRLLRQFLEAGVQPEAALKTLDNAMALRGEETGSFTTMDLCIFDPSTGEAAFYKYGAAPSYLKKGGVVRRITGGSWPVGLRSAAGGPDVTRMRLEPGSFVVMISDGVADPAQDDWLQNLLAGWEGEDPRALAEAVIEESVKRRELADDCGVQVLYRPADGLRRV